MLLIDLTKNFQITRILLYDEAVAGQLILQTFDDLLFSLQSYLAQ